MNVSELARRLRIPIQELRLALPQIGFDIGSKAIKVDDRVAQKITEAWPAYLRHLEERRKKLLEEQRERIRAENQDKEIAVGSFITVRDYAQKLGISINQILTELMKNGVLASMNERIDFDTAAIIGEDLGFHIVQQEGNTLHDEASSELVKDVLSQEETSHLVPRPPVIVVMGHVDHGKTKLLDTIRETDVVSSEKGGITQHIGAYQVEKDGKRITFIDTPGHEAFTAMRSRGAKIADIAILVVAADDSLKPQTLEAIKIIEKEKLPMVVAINKIDKPEANIEKVKQDLASINLLPEDWGGKVITVPISAKDGKNITQLLEMVLLVAELEKEKIVANPDGRTVGSIIDSRIDKGEGNVATVIVQNGTLRVGDHIYIGNVLFGKVRSMKDWHGDSVQCAPPAMPVKLIGLKVSPQVGDMIEASLERRNVEVADKRKIKSLGQLIMEVAPSNEETEQKQSGVAFILKTDVLGSAEAIIESLQKIEHPDVFVKVISRKLGNVTESDVIQAEAEKAYVLGFNVHVPPPVAYLSKEKKVVVKVFHVIYELLDFVKSELQKLLVAEILQSKIGVAEVIMVFRKEGNSAIVGCRVKEGLMESNTKVKFYRKNELMAEGKIEQLRVGKEDVKDVLPGQECGIKFVGKPLMEVGDMVEVYKEAVREKKII